ncbi:MAG: hypothetical protein U9N49_07065 [Campylobacterota bacterium]|nr:hypothetical protein [Campylobacterota bacterium]
MEIAGSLLPPILVSLAPIIILLFKVNPFHDTISKEQTPLLIVIHILIVWVVYIFVTILAYNYTFFNPSVTMISLIISLTTFSILFKQIANKKNINLNRLSLLFYTGVIFALIGFTNYAESKDKIVVFFKNYPSMIQVSYEYSNKKYKIPIQKGWNGYAIIFNNENEWKKINNQKINIKYKEQNDNGEIVDKEKNKELKTYFLEKWLKANVYIIDF